MKRKKRKDPKNEIIKFLLVVIAILLLVITLILNNKKTNINETNNKKEEIVYKNNITYNGLKIDKGINDLIVNYMDLYYKSISELEYNDMSNLFSSEKEAYKNKTAIELLIESRKLHEFDMKLNKAKYDINYVSYEEDDGIYTVEITENGYFNFNFMKDITSKVYGVENTFIIEKINDEYKIKKYDKVQDFYVMIDEKFDNETNYKEELDRIKSDYLVNIEENIEDLKQEYEEYKDGYEIDIEAEYKYNRENALSYANKYVTKRNDEWPKYDTPGGNCQNYASQVLYAGGIPMDYNGTITSQWKHYSSEPNEDEEKSGRSYSWTGVGYFYTYAKNNKGYGLVAKVDANYYSALEGDVAQVGYDGYGHSVVVVGSVKDKDNNIIDILVNSNTIDMENYPLQGYTYPNKRIIKIIGYNK